MTIEEMNKRKEELGLTYKKISELSGVPLSTVQKVLGGYTDSPRFSTVKALTDVLLYESRKQSPLATYHYSDYVLGADFEKDVELYNLVAETSNYGSKTSNAWKLDDGTEPMKTVDDYFKLEDDRRVELVDGLFYDMATPSAEHQLICSEIHSAFKNFILKNKGKCVPLLAPYDVQIKKDNINMVEPDVMIICDKSKIQDNKVFGAPDLVVEVVSKTSGSHDYIRKLNTYMNSKVREYWIVDPFEKRVSVYQFEKGYRPDEYTFEDKVPVGIYDGKCKVDFKEIMDVVDILLN